MKAIKIVCACVFGLMAFVGLLSLAQLALYKILRLADNAPPTEAVLGNLILTLVFAALCVACGWSASKTVSSKDASSKKVKQ